MVRVTMTNAIEFESGDELLHRDGQLWTVKQLFKDGDTPMVELKDGEEEKHINKADLEQLIRANVYQFAEEREMSVQFRLEGFMTHSAPNAPGQILDADDLADEIATEISEMPPEEIADLAEDVVIETIVHPSGQPIYENHESQHGSR